MKYLLTALIFSAGLANAETSCETVRRQILAQVIADDYKFGQTKADVFNDIEQYYTNPAGAMVIFCSDGYSEGDDKSRGYRLCDQEAKLCYPSK